MITHFSHRFAGLCATGIWLSLNAAYAPAQSTRPYQMSIVGTTEGSTTVDIPIFHYTHSQPAGRSIVWLDPERDLDQANVDWTRIVAAYVDEPYNNIIPDRDSSRCDSSAPAVANRIATLRTLASGVRVKAPSARFWVNFRKRDIDFIRGGCSLNQPYIDVISMDIYAVDFSPDLSSRYQWLANNRVTPYQQLALVPGTFTGGGGNQSGTQGAARLSGYFTYANSMNQHCDLPLGPMGRTGIYDGCPVWTVAGWLGGTQPHTDPNGVVHYPIDHPAAILVRNAWQATFAIPRVDPARVRQAIKAIPLLFND